MTEALTANSLNQPWWTKKEEVQHGGEAKDNVTSDMQGLIWGEPELAHEYDFDVENI